MRSMLLLAAAVMTLSSETLKRPDVTLHYHKMGSGKPIVMLAGGPGFDVRYMEPITEVLNGARTFVFLEQRGTGRSKLPEISSATLALPLYVEDLEALRIALKQDRIDLLGHSWGGMLAMAYATKYPSRIGKMVLVGSAGVNLRFQESMSENIRTRMSKEDLHMQAAWSTPERRAADPDRAMIESLKAATPGYFHDRKKAIPFRDQLRVGALTRGVMAAVMGSLPADFDLAAGLKAVNAPVLIVHGDSDPIPVTVAQEIERAIMGARLQIVPKAGHFPWIEQPHSFRKAVAPFLK